MCLPCWLQTDIISHQPPIQPPDPRALKPKLESFNPTSVLLNLKEHPATVKGCYAKNLSYKVFFKAWINIIHGTCSHLSQLTLYLETLRAFTIWLWWAALTKNYIPHIKHCSTVNLFHLKCPWCEGPNFQQSPLSLWCTDNSKTACTLTGNLSPGGSELWSFCNCRSLCGAHQKSSASCSPTTQLQLQLCIWVN